MSVFRKKILVVDDEEVVRDFYRESLTLKGYDVETAGDGVEGLERLRDSVFDLVITDVRMPRLDGLAFYESAIETYPYLGERFLFITSFVPAGYRYYPKIRNRVVEKPFRMDLLLDTISRLTCVPVDEQLERAEADRRRWHRLFCEQDCRITADGLAENDPLTAKIQDVSARGIRVKYFGDPVKCGDLVNLRVGNEDNPLLRAGHVVWARGINRLISAGIELTEPLTETSMEKLRETG